MLVDTSVWVDQLRSDDPALKGLLDRGEVECHPFIIGELALGSLRRRSEILALLQKLPQVRTASHEEVLAFIDRRHITGRGVGWVDAHLLASAALEGTLLWTRDRRLAGLAQSLSLGAQP